MKKNIYFYFIIIASVQLNAQTVFNFQKYYGGTGLETGEAIIQTNEGKILSVGGCGDAAFICLLNGIGDMIWTRRINSGNYFAEGSGVAETDDSAFLIAGTCRAINGGYSDIYLIKVNYYGDTLWTKTFGSQYSDFGFDMIKLRDGNFLIAGSINYLDVNPQNADLFLLKINQNGDTIWTRQYEDLNYQEEARTLAEGPDSSLYISGSKTGVSNDNYSYLQKCNSAGNSIWSRTYGNSWSRGVDITDDYGCITIGTFNDGASNQVYVNRFDSAGTVLWTKLIGTSGTDAGFDIKSTKEGGSIFTGYEYSFSTASVDILIGRLDSQGDTLWLRTQGSTGTDQGAKICKGIDNTYLITGRYEHSTIDIDMVVYRIKEVYNKIRGRVINDLNLNCGVDSTDSPITGIILRADPGPYYSVSDSLGNFKIEVDTGNYSIQQLNNNSIWTGTCQLSYPVSFTTIGDSIDGLNFYDFANAACSKLTIDLSSQDISLDGSTLFNIKYCNIGATTAFNTLIRIDFGAYVLDSGNSVVPVSSSLPWVNNQPGIYEFNTGDLPSNFCGSLNIVANFAGTIGTTNCIVSKIFPDTSCVTQDTAYGERQFLLIGYCGQNDTAYFKLRNDLTQSFLQSGIYKIYRNSVLEAVDTFGIDSGDSLLVAYPSGGGTIRMKIDFIYFPNPHVYPGPTLAIESCGANTLPGFITEYPINQYDNLTTNNYCFLITGSFDPNDKKNIPTGLTSNHYISPKDHMEYQINFQNTGNDTATYIIIRDTISPYLDISSIIDGPSSHPHSFNVYGQGIAEWVFNPIALPDSNVDEAASHGFVKYKIKQNEGNLYGSLIKNSASIYFDYNAPVITNITTNTVCESPISSFTNVNSGDSVYFSNQSVNSTKYFWMFGDGQSDTSQSPVHLYPGSGLFNVCLFAMNDCEMSLVCNQLSVISHCGYSRKRF